jgi:hypothetical protein
MAWKLRRSAPRRFEIQPRRTRMRMTTPVVALSSTMRRAIDTWSRPAGK